MSKIRYIYYNVALIALIMLGAACSSDGDAVTDGPDAPNDGMSKVTLRIGTADSRGGSTRAGYPSEEGMNIWVVVIADKNDNAKKMLACKTANDHYEEDNIETKIELTNGSYNFYSFANMSVAKVKELLSVTSELADNDLTETGKEVIRDASGKVNATGKAVAVNGNSFNAFDKDSNNGFGFYGIPMSNKQTFEIRGDVEKDLIVIRMLAKMKLEIKNETGVDVTLKNIAISNITGNAEDRKTNLMLLPKLSENGANIDVHVHGDIQPNLSGDAEKVVFNYSVTGDAIEIGYRESKDITFYINESVAPDDGLFELTLTKNNGEYRYAVIDNSNDDEDDNGKWNYIARNDYRIIPITLDDYKLELIPYDFPPIGVLPASVRTLDESKNLYEMTFHDYGHFHLVPKVTKMSDNSSVPYNAGGTDGAYWTLNTDWANSWLTYDTFGGTLSTDGNPGGFYVVETTPSTVDGSENGGIPVLDTQTTWNGFSPFIFGNIAKPSSDGEKSVYHEFKVKLHTPTYERYMIYRFNMVLSADRMLSPVKRNALPHRPH